MNNFRDAVLLFDKKKGLTSFSAISEVKRLLGIKKIGHSGTLDKSASGLLVIGTGRATKLAKFFLDEDKRYTGIIQLGVITDTCDCEGKVLERRDCAKITEEQILKIKNAFTGELNQTPPHFSALKIKGQRASDIARSGGKVSLEPRRINIRELNIIDIDLVNAEVAVDVVCSKGTYIRSLALDIGNFLGTGAYLKELRRTRSGHFKVNDAVTIDELDDFLKGGTVLKRFLYSPLEALSNFGKIVINGNSLSKIFNGAIFQRSDTISMENTGDGTYLITDEKKNLIAIADIEVDNWSIRYLNVFNNG